MNILIAVPAMDSVSTAFVNSLVHLRPPKDADMDIQFVTNSLIYDARDKLASLACDGNYDFVLWLDSDMVFEPDICQKLLLSLGDDDAVSALYFTRRFPKLKPCVFKTCTFSIDKETKEVIPDAENYFGFPENQKFEAAAFGFGCVLMRTSALRAVMERYGLPFLPALGFGEDLSFCIRARELGFKLACDSRIIVKHEGKILIGAEEYYNSLEA